MHLHAAVQNSPKPGRIIGVSDRNNVCYQNCTTVQKPILCSNPPCTEERLQIRMCNESCKLNEVTQEDVYHLSRIDKMLEALKSSNYFSVSDLCHGFNNVPVKEYDK